MIDVSKLVNSLSTSPSIEIIHMGENLKCLKVSNFLLIESKYLINGYLPMVAEGSTVKVILINVKHEIIDSFILQDTYLRELDLQSYLLSAKTAQQIKNHLNSYSFLNIRFKDRGEFDSKSKSTSGVTNWDLSKTKIIHVNKRKL